MAYWLLSSGWPTANWVQYGLPPTEFSTAYCQLSSVRPTANWVQYGLPTIDFRMAYWVQYGLLPTEFSMAYWLLISGWPTAYWVQYGLLPYYFTVVLTYLKVKQSLHKPWGFQEVEAPRISRQSAHEGDKVVWPKHQSSLPHRKYSWYSFLPESESTYTQGHNAAGRIMPMKTCNDTVGNRTRAFRLVAQYWRNFCL
jgi:hypothetical protein